MCSDDELPDLESINYINRCGFSSNTNYGSRSPRCERTKPTNDFYSDSSDVEIDPLPSLAERLGMQLQKSSSSICITRPIENLPKIRPTSAVETESKSLHKEHYASVGSSTMVDISSSDDDDNNSKVNNYLPNTQSLNGDANYRSDSEYSLSSAVSCTVSSTVSSRTTCSSVTVSVSDDPVPLADCPTDAVAKKRRKRTISDPDVAKMQKLEEKVRKQQEREGKKLEKERAKAEKEHWKAEAEFEKTRKRMLREADRDSRPGECLKHMTVVLEASLLSLPSGTAIAGCLQSAGVHYEVHASQAVTCMISFFRTVTDIVESGEKKLESVTRDVTENQIVLYLRAAQFIPMIDEFHREKQGVSSELYRLAWGSPDTLSDELPSSPTLNQFIESTQATVGSHIHLTIIVHGLDVYFKQKTIDERRVHQARVASLCDSQGPPPVELAGTRRGRKGKTEHGLGSNVTRAMIDEALVCAQLMSPTTSVRLIESDVDVAKFVLSICKSIAEKPFKQSRQKSGLGLFMDGGRTIKVGKEGQGLMQIWREQLMQTTKVGAEVASAIISHYPSPLLLMTAYESCSTEKEAELLLQNIEVRRGAGILSTVRRIGKETSRRLHSLFTSRDANFVIK